jgi:hypothetical protein
MVKGNHELIELLERVSMKKIIIGQFVRGEV